MIVEVFLLFSGFALKWTVHAQFGSISIGVGMEDERNDDGGQDLLKGPCPANTTCMPISMCPMLGDLLDFSCFSSDKYFHRLNELTCGHMNGEDYVCCPSCSCGQVYPDNTAQCGRSMVQGAGYKGLGAQPWVARIGFTHYVCCPSCSCGQVYPDNTAQCGRSMVQGAGYKGLGAQPWVARIGFTQKESGIVRFACSGSIISKRVVLTAAHCALAKPEGYKLSTVVVGEYDTNRGSDCSELFCAPPTQAIKVENVVVHVGYEQKIFRHDIALIVLKDEMKYSVSVAPICLNDKPEIVINERALLVGWGKLSGQNNLVSRQQQLEVPLVPLATCERIFGESVPVHEGQLCAGGEEGRDACSGFGGAPLLLSRDGQYVQVGIVSFGSENCGSEGVPSVYTNIAHYHKWIVDNSPS